MQSHSDRQAFTLFLRLPALLTACVALAACAPKAVSNPGTASATKTTATIPAGESAGDADATTTTTAARAIRPVETFDMVWTTVRDNHFDKDLNGVDWIAIREELRPKAVSVATQDELRLVLLDMLGRLGQSHFTIIPGDVAEESPVIDSPREQVRAPEGDDAPRATATTTAAGTTTDASGGTGAIDTTAAYSGPGIAGFDVALVEGEATVLRVKESSPAAAAGVRPGWIVVAVGSRRITDQLASMREALAREEKTSPGSPHARQLRTELAVAGESALQAPAGMSIPVTFGTPEGERTIDVAFLPAPYGAPEFGNLPALPIEVDSSVLEIPAAGKPIRIGVISFNIWLTGASRAIDEAVDGLRTCDGIVIDLRGNPGGLGVMSTGVAGHFLAESASLGSMIGRDSTLKFNATPRKVSTAGKRVRPYSRPLAILVDARSASTSEVFAGGLQDLGRARIFGETSAGMALPAQAIELPNGDVLMHAVADFVTDKGTRLEGRGVIPDEVAVPTRAALLEGNDAALVAATRWIGDRTLASRAAKAGTSPVEAVTAPTSMPTPAPTQP
jgi:carboxyl-terminal processing protease